MDLNNKNFVITGAGKGIGKEALKLIVKYGGNVSMITRSDKDIKDLKKILPENKVLFHRGDVSSKLVIEKFYKSTIKKMKRIHGLVNNAGIRQRKDFLKLTPKDLKEVIDNNLLSCFYCMQIFSKNMIKFKGGSIVNVASIVGPHGLPNLSGYAATKSAIIGLSKSAAVELIKYKIRVNTICPGFIKTSFEKNFKKKHLNIYNFTKKRTPMGRWGTPNEVANLIAFLLSDKSSYITGTEHFIDGGWNAA